VAGLDRSWTTNKKAGLPLLMATRLSW